MSLRGKCMLTRSFVYGFYTLKIKPHVFINFLTFSMYPFDSNVCTIDMEGITMLFLNNMNFFYHLYKVQLFMCVNIVQTDAIRSEHFLV